jgi:pilus assembly protein CpaB
VKKRGIFLIVSLLLGIMAGLLVYQQIRSYKLKIARAERELVSVVVAARPKDAFSIITAEDVKVVRMPRSSIPTGEVLSLDEVVGKASMLALSEGDPVLKGKLSLDPEKLGVAFLICYKVTKSFQHLYYLPYLLLRYFFYCTGIIIHVSF